MTLYIFILSVCCIFYVYIGYPLLIYFFARLKTKPVGKGDYEPRVTVLIAAHNEEEHIAATLQNKLDLDYPSGKLEIVVVSDGSTDDTDATAKGFEDQGVVVLRQEPRAGKTAALNLGIRHASGEVVVFSDANSLYRPDALRQLVRNLADPRVGYVTGNMVYTDADGTIVGDGCSAYMRYENALRRQETRLGSVVGVDGGIDVVRKDLYRPMKPDQLPDFVLPLQVVEQGYRVVYEPRALLCEASLREPTDEFRMRVRVALRSFWALWDLRRLLRGGGGMMFCWQLWSHKVLRYLCFIFLIAAYVTNGWLAFGGNGAFQWLFLLQNIAYLAGGLANQLESRRLKVPGVRLLYYLFLLNAASAFAFFKFLARHKQVVWVPRKG